LHRAVIGGLVGQRFGGLALVRHFLHEHIATFVVIDQQLHRFIQIIRRVVQLHGCDLGRGDDGGSFPEAGRERAAQLRDASLVSFSSFQGRFSHTFFSSGGGWRGQCLIKTPPCVQSHQR
jgi:hypothetical protein